MNNSTTKRWPYPGICWSIRPHVAMLRVVAVAATEVGRNGCHIAGVTAICIICYLHRHGATEELRARARAVVKEAADAVPPLRRFGDFCLVGKRLPIPTVLLPLIAEQARAEGLPKNRMVWRMVLSELRTWHAGLADFVDEAEAEMAQAPNAYSQCLYKRRTGLPPFSVRDYENPQSEALARGVERRKQKNR